MGASHITGLVLAGGRGSRMGGVDKGLQPFRGVPLTEHVLRRLAPQVGAILVNANRNLDTYAAMDVEVAPDELADYAGPLAGFAAGLARCRTEWMLTVPCDTPLFPMDLARRLMEAAQDAGADIAVAAATEDGRLRAQPVFCLLRASLRPDLHDFLQAGGRKIDAWTARHRNVLASFDTAADDPLAFANANTLDELRRLESS